VGSVASRGEAREQWQDDRRHHPIVWRALSQFAIVRGFGGLAYWRRLSSGEAESMKIVLEGDWAGAGAGVFVVVF
jgi:hypothetical protein